ncbi:MAG: hypothetical protein CYPHOPRED_002953 [Cyphobasidiales sp. Tagirdzhanova-0007]|nr:MAG: hypothetical protein CYPHOPRED_002953 [Cyphobasidiales sp. Tagirdzhanova-0007]
MRLPSEPKKRVFHGCCVHSLTNRKLEYLRDALLAVDEAGFITFLQPDVARQDIAAILRQQDWQDVEVVDLERGQFLIPGLIDTHTHAPQYPNLGRGQQYQLLDWLSHLTFPTEAKFDDPIYAAKTYESVVNRVINTGTTTCCWYGTLHVEASKILASILHRRGQRCFVGKCNMDRHSRVDYVEKSASVSIADTKEFIKFVRQECCSTREPGTQSTSSDSPKLSNGILHHRQHHSSNHSYGDGDRAPQRRSSTAGSSVSQSSSSALSSTSTAMESKSTEALVQPIITPRFAISCSDALMAGLQALVGKDSTLHIQTHLAENPAEIEYTKQLFPFTDSYTQVYDHFGLLTSKTILAHCVHLTESEMTLIKKRRSGISHCPTSNNNLRSGCSPIAELLDHDIKVGLGTDVSGGFGMGILTALREASVVSKVLGFGERTKVEADQKRGRSMTPKGGGLPSIEGDSADAPALKVEKFAGNHLPLETLFFLATLGGAEVCDMSERIGNFVVGKEFDALLVHTGQKEPGYEGDPFANQPNPALFIEEEDALETIFEKFLFAGDDRNIASVFVRGRVIGGAAPLQCPV